MDPSQLTQQTTALLFHQGQLSQAISHASNPAYVSLQTGECSSSVKYQSTSRVEPVCNYNSYEHLSALEIIAKIIHRNYSRHFLKRLMFAYIQSLKKPRPSHSASNYWNQYSMVKNRTPEEQEWFQFLNLCAQIIQSNFKSYLTRRRHKITLQKAHKAKDLICSLLKRWKIYRIYNCEKIASIRSKIRQIQTEIDEEQEKMGHRDTKKLKALYKYAEINAKMFTDTFSMLRETGMWTLEKNMKKINLIKYSQQNPVMEFKTKDRSPQIQQRQSRSSFDEHRKENVDHNASNQFIYEFSKPSNLSTLEDRPIKATGEYKISETEISENTTLGSQFQKSDAQQDREITRKQRDRKKQELNKRIKYDPKKAIEQEKNRRKQQNKTEAKDKSNQISRIPTQNDQEKLIEVGTFRDPQDGKKKNKQEKQLKEGAKTREVKLDQKLIKKVTSKIDCWGTKKQAEPEWVKQYKTRILENKSQSLQKSDDFRKSLQKNKKEIKYESSVSLTRMKQATKVSEELDSRAQVCGTHEAQQKSSNDNWRNREKQIQILRKKQEQFVGQRKNSTHNLQEHIKSLVDRKTKKKEVHRPIEQLEQTYNKHYGDRFRNLMPKLSLLAVARSQERESSIPILEDLSEEFGEWFEQLYNSTQYWKIASQHDRVFKSFIIS